MLYAPIDRIRHVTLVDAEMKGVRDEPSSRRERDEESIQGHSVTLCSLFSVEDSRALLPSKKLNVFGSLTTSSPHSCDF